MLLQGTAKNMQPLRSSLKAKMEWQIMLFIEKGNTAKSDKWQH